MASLYARFNYLIRKLIADSRSLRESDPEDVLRISLSSSPTSEDGGELAAPGNQALQQLSIAGVYKTTRPGRLRETERVIGKFLRREEQSIVRFLDVGASDGSTTLDVINVLRVDGIRVEAHLADRFLELKRYQLGPLIEYRTVNGDAVLARIWKVGIIVSLHRPDAVAQLYNRFEWVRRQLKFSGTIPLVDPRVLSQPDVHLHGLDCFTRDISLEGRFDVVRASNILNFCYFPPDRISVALEHLHAYLREGGLLVVSRNVPVGEGEVEHGSIWRRRGEGFELLEDFGDGSEIGYLVNPSSSTTHHLGVTQNGEQSVPA